LRGQADSATVQERGCVADRCHVDPAAAQSAGSIHKLMGTPPHASAADRSVDPVIVRVPLVQLRRGLSPRSQGEDYEHVCRLVESGGALPPVLVHRPTMRVIDGMHRVTAALTRGEQQIDVIFLDVDEEDAFILAVQANAAHGLPLTLPDRRAAATRILRARPVWSDRRVAAATGLSPKTVGVLRRSTEEVPRLMSREGLDGRTRIVQPMLSNQLGRTPSARRLRMPTASALPGTGDRDRGGAAPCGELGKSAERATAVSMLQRDPSVRSTDAGRALLRLLRETSLEPARWQALAAAVPPHQVALAVGLARACATRWADFAQQLSVLQASRLVESQTLPHARLRHASPHGG
jgi:ParB-like chromosome segregation protein Spo0J